MSAAPRSPTGPRTGTAHFTLPRAEIVAPLPWTLDPAAGLLRDHVVPRDRRPPDYEAQYDRTTLFYDCVYLPGRDSYLFTAPRFVNLWAPFRAGLRIDGHPVRRVRRQIWKRCEQVEVRAPRGALSLKIAGREAPVIVRDTLAPRFAGLDCLVGISRDNDLQWLRDWAGHHARAHGTEGVLLFENGSTRYAAEDVRATLGEIDGLREVVVMPVPFRFGPTVAKKGLRIYPRFLQTATLNLARRDAFARARTAMCLDIDELVRCEGGRSVHDLAARHPLGMVTVHGRWVYPSPGTEQAQPHTAHVWRSAHGEKCNRKWCLRPDGPMGGFGWGVHKVGGPLQNLFSNLRDCHFLHCRATSTGWKPGRFSMPPELYRDPALEAFMAARFPGRTEAE